MSGKPTVVVSDRRRPSSYRRSTSREASSPYHGHHSHREHTGGYESRVSHVGGGYERHDRGYPSVRGPPTGSAPGPWSPRSDGRKPYYGTTGDREVRAPPSSSYDPPYHRGVPRSDVEYTRVAPASWNNRSGYAQDYGSERGVYDRSYDRRPTPYPAVSSRNAPGRSRSPPPTRGTC